jgi:hypothetical protein
MPFHNKLSATETDPENRRWTLNYNLRYQGGWQLFVIPKGFETDFASVPRAFTAIIPKQGRWTRAAVLHDWLVSKGVVSRKDADGIFRRAMKESGVGWQRKVMYAALRVHAFFTRSK